MMELVKLETPWGSFRATRDAKGRLYCPICKRFTAYSAKDLVYHISFHVFSGNGKSKVRRPRWRW